MKGQPIRIIDEAFLMQAEIEDYESLLFTRRYDSFGSFELHINQNKNYVEHLKIGAILFISPQKAGIIQYREYTMDSTGKESQTLTIRGFTLEHLLSYRITEVSAGKEVYEATGKTEDVLKNMIAYNLGSTCTNKNRIISIIQIAPTKNRGIDTAVSTCLLPLDEECQKILSKAGMGLKITLDYSQKKFLLDIYEGRNLTTEQSLLPPVIFSEEFDNIASRNLVDSWMEYKNTAVVVGKESSQTNLKEIIFDECMGLARREMFIDAGNMEKDTLVTLAQRGKDVLLGFKPVYTLEGSAIPYSSFRYEEDYALGDLVTVRFQDGSNQIHMHTRIVEVTELYDDSGTHIEVVFGQKVPTIVDKIKQIVKGK